VDSSSQSTKAGFTSSIRLPANFSITARQAHNVLAKLCIRYLDFLDSEVDVAAEEDGLNTPFFDYAINWWGDHFREAQITDGDYIIPATLRICSPKSSSYMFFCESKTRVLFPRPEENATDLMIASYFGLYAIAKLLINDSANIEAKDRSYRTPVYWAVLEGHEATVKLLIGRGADIEAKNIEGQTPLWIATWEQNEAIIKLLIKKGADIEAKNIEGQTPLWIATWEQNEAIIKLLIKKGADIEAKDIRGRTPLMIATWTENEAIIKLLIERGADIEAKDIWDKTPLLIATWIENEAIIKLLIERGADIEAKDIRDKTPLLIATQTENEAISGQTPLAIAKKGRLKTIYRLLLAERVAKKTGR
jgi:ankyrin repeat protein